LLLAIAAAAGEEFGVPVYPGADEVEDTSNYLDAWQCIEAAFIGPPWGDGTPGMKTNNALITITMPEEQELLPKPGDPEPRGPFWRAFFFAQQPETADKCGKKPLTIIRQTVIKYPRCFKPRKRSG
jgi:hypothetical protein